MNEFPEIDILQDLAIKNKTDNFVKTEMALLEMDYMYEDRNLEVFQEEEYFDKNPDSTNTRAAGVSPAKAGENAVDKADAGRRVLFNSDFQVQAAEFLHSVEQMKVSWVDPAGSGFFHKPSNKPSEQHWVKKKKGSFKNPRRTARHSGGRTRH